MQFAPCMYNLESSQPPSWLPFSTSADACWQLQVIVRSNSYIHAIQKMQRALYEFQIRGVKTNILFLENVLRHPEFLSGRATTSFIDDNPQLFNFHQDAGSQSSQVLTYLADMVCQHQQACHLGHVISASQHALYTG